MVGRRCQGTFSLAESVPFAHQVAKGSCFHPTFCLGVHYYLREIFIMRAIIIIIFIHFLFLYFIDQGGPKDLT